MMGYSVQPRDRIFVKGDEFLSFAKNMGKIIGKNISKHLSGKSGQKLLDHAKKSATDPLKISSKRVIQKKQNSSINYNSIIMEYQKVINLLDNTQNQPTKYRTKNWVEINDEEHRAYNTKSQIKFKISMLRQSLCDYSDA